MNNLTAVVLCCGLFLLHVNCFPTENEAKISNYNILNTDLKNNTGAFPNYEMQNFSKNSADTSPGNDTSAFAFGSLAFTKTNGCPNPDQLRDQNGNCRDSDD